MNDNSSLLTKPVVAALLAIFCTLLWGSAYPAIKIGYELFQVGSDDTAAKMAYAGLRFTLGGLLVLAIRPLMGKSQGGIRTLKKRHWKQIIILGLLQTTIHYTFFYIGLSYTSGSKGAIINASSCSSAPACPFFHADDKITTQRPRCRWDSAQDLREPGWRSQLLLFASGEGFIILAALLHSSSGLYSKHIAKRWIRSLTGLQLAIGGRSLAIGLLMGRISTAVSADIC